MATERMYDLAFRYKKEKLWKKLYDSDIFAVKLSDGAIGYCCVMGMAGEVNALALYVGDEGFQSYWNLAGPRRFALMSRYDYQEMLLSQDCLQCVFDNKDALSDDELAEVRAYTKAHGITLRGANAFPQFMKYQPNRLPWDIVTDLDKQRICEALEACLALSDRLQTKSKREIGLTDTVFTTKTLPLFEREGDQYSITRAVVPPEMPIAYPAPRAANDISIARIKRLKKMGVLECEVVRLPEPVQEHEGEAPYFPVLLLAVDKETERVYPPKPVMYFEEHPEQLLDVFEESLIGSGRCPIAIEANDERTFALLQDLCKKAGIRLSLAEDELAALEDAKDSLMSAMLRSDEDQDAMANEAFYMLMSLSDSDLQQIPQEAVRQLLQLADAGVLPPELEVRLRRVLDTNP